LVVVEIKTGNMPKWAALQTAAQGMAVGIKEDLSWHKIKRIGLELRRDGGYRIFPFTDPNDGPVFLSCVAAYTYKLNNGI